jgi:oxygen-independent coproporphyrinogen-3 oxidase
MTQEKAKGYVKGGINRVSLGVQDFNPHVQKLINRIQPFEMTKDIVGWLRVAGIRGINFDLMYGLPGQTLEDVLNNVDQAVKLTPDRLAVFGYAHVPWMKGHQKLILEEDLPASPFRLQMAEAIARRLIKNGYIQIGLDHFARAEDSLVKAFEKGTLRRNFQGYTTDTASSLIAFGASSIGHLPGGFVQNTPDMKTYSTLIKEGKLATARGVGVLAEDHSRWKIIEHLMCQNRIEACTLKEFPFEATQLADFKRDGLVEKNGQGLSITESGVPYVRQIAAVFDQYLQKNTTKHSKAI